jgi:glutamyl-tRNA reductase
MHVFVTGVNFRTASIDVLEKIFVKENELGISFEKLRTEKELDEAVLLSTCNRVELYGVLNTRKEPSLSADTYFHHIPEIFPPELKDLIYFLQGRSAVYHLFKVTSSIDSMVVGEPQITGQVKKAFEIARSYNGTGKVFNYLFPKAFSVGKKVRTQTDLSKGSVSVASMGIRRAKEFFPDFSDKSALLIGAGEMAESVAFHLQNNHPEKLYIFNRTQDRASLLAQKYGGTAVSEIHEVITRADIIITSISSNKYLLTRAKVLHIMELRKNRPLVIVDIGIPRNVDPEVGTIENVHVINMDDLDKVVTDHKARRESEILQAENIIQKEVDSFIYWFNRLSLDSTISDLKRKLEKMCADLVSSNMKNMKGSDGLEEIVRHLSQSLANKILHDPITVLKSLDESERKSFLDAICRLFRLEINSERAGRGILDTGISDELL